MSRGSGEEVRARDQPPHRVLHLLDIPVGLRAVHQNEFVPAPIHELKSERVGEPNTPDPVAVVADQVRLSSSTMMVSSWEDTSA